MEIPILADLVSRGDGTFVLRPPVQDPETWIRLPAAAKILCRSVRQLRPHLGELLVYRRRTPRTTEVSLRSVKALQQAAKDPRFWRDRQRQAALQRQVYQTMAKLIEPALHP